MHYLQYSRPGSAGSVKLNAETLWLSPGDWLTLECGRQTFRGISRVCRANEQFLVQSPAKILEKNEGQKLDERARAFDGNNRRNVSRPMHDPIQSCKTYIKVRRCKVGSLTSHHA